MTFKQFLTEYREEIDQVIRKQLSNPQLQISVAERRLWVLNHEGLYFWARSEGVRI